MVEIKCPICNGEGKILVSFPQRDKYLFNCIRCKKYYSEGKFLSYEHSNDDWKKDGYNISSIIRENNVLGLEPLLMHKSITAAHLSGG